LAVVLELLIPNSSMQRYVRMVVGLLLLLVLLKPVLTIFEVNPEEMFKNFSQEKHVSDEEIKNSMENTKSEIQASQLAYIEQRMDVQLKKDWKKEVSDRFHVELDSVDVKLDKAEVDQSKPAIQRVNV